MNNLIKITSILGTFLITSCVTVQKTQEVAPKVNDTYQTEWTQQIPVMKEPLRACIIKHKSTDGILYIENKGHETEVLISDQNEIYSCIVHNESQKVISLQLSDRTPPKNLPKFYPVGRSVLNCKSPSKQLDIENRFMGTVCR